MKEFNLDQALYDLPSDIMVTQFHDMTALCGDNWLVMIGDSFEYMALMKHHQVMPKYDHIICDPPYTEATHKGAKSGRGGKVSDQGIHFDVFSDYAMHQFVEFSSMLCRRWILAFCEVEMLGDYRKFACNVSNVHNTRKPASKSWIRSGLWIKTDPAPQFTGDRPGVWGEGIAIMHSQYQAPKWNKGGCAGIWKPDCDETMGYVESTEKGKDRFHSTQKPVALMTALMDDFTSPGESIFDPFMGSGTTGVAALRRGCIFEGVERDPEMAIQAALRLSAETKGLSHHDQKIGQTSIFG